jgi:hypothetical protein
LEIGSFAEQKVPSDDQCLGEFTGFAEDTYMRVTFFDEAETAVKNNNGDNNSNISLNDSIDDSVVAAAATTIITSTTNPFEES